MKPSEVISTTSVEPEWVVEGIIPRGTIVILAGEAGAGKSVLSYTMAYSVALGAPFLGHPTRPMNVAYFDEENGYPDFAQYNQWVWAGLGCPSLDTLDERLTLEHFSLANGWREVMHQTLDKVKPGLVIIDTASPAFHIKDENDNGEANVALARLRRILQATGCKDSSVLILKHEKQRDDVMHRRTIRGAKAWLGAVDQVLYHVIAPGARRRHDGLRKTRLEPGKLRAFALKATLEINPRFTPGPPKGLILNARPLDATTCADDDTEQHT